MTEETNTVFDFETNEDEQTIQRHNEWLRTSCRICGQKVPKFRSKLTFKEEFSDIFNINVAEENKLIYPENVCSRHASVLYRYREAKTKGKSYNTHISLAIFGEHSNNECHCLAGISDHLYTTSTKKRKMDYDYEQTAIGRTSIISVDLEKSDGQDISSSYLEECVDHLYKTYQNIETNIRTKALSSFVKNLKYEDRLTIVNAVIDCESKDISSDIDSIQNIYSSLSSLYKFNIGDYLNKRNGMVKHIVNCFSKHKNNDENDLVNNAIVVELLYKSKNKHFVGPVSLIQNLTILSLTGSKTAVDIVGTLIPGGKYKTLCRWLENNTSNVPTGPAGDAVYMFDNEQVVGKSWYVKPQNKCKSSVITNVAAVPLNSTLCYQSELEYHPGRWFIREKSVAAVTKLLDCNDEQSNLLKQVHSTQFKLFVNAAIDLVLEEQIKTPHLIDDIDKQVEDLQKRNNYKLCLNCNSLHAKSKRKCPQCKSVLSHIECSGEESGSSSLSIMEKVHSSFPKNSPAMQTEERYEFVQSGHSMEANVKIIDPVFVNPNSYENLALVLRHIGKNAGIKRYGGNEREWLIICCDGLPYSMILYLTQEYFVCSECNEKIMGESNFAVHYKEKHKENESVQKIQEFDWVLLKTGDGHYEMNLLKSFIELNWDVFFKQLSQKMGWVSEMALKSAKNCYDNHKTWQLFQIFHFGTLMELVLPYVRDCVTEATKPDADGFFTYVENRKSDPNYAYMFEMVSRYSQGILNFRIGIRRNNSLLIQSAKMMTRNLFHGRNHPKYQEIELVDSMLRLLMPDELRHFFERHESITKSSDHSKGQGYDFILEELNKEIKSWIRRGVPSDLLWLTVCRNHDLLKDIKESTFQMLNLSMDLNTRNVDLKEGIFAWRVLLRETKYLTDDHILHSNIQGSNLHPGLHKFTESSNSKRSWRLMQYFLDNTCPEQNTTDLIDLRKPVYVTYEESEKFESIINQPIAYIDQLSMKMIDSVNELETQQMLLQKFKTSVRGKTKQVHISFFEEVMEIVDSIMTEALPDLNSI